MNKRIAEYSVMIILIFSAIVFTGCIELHQNDILSEDIGSNFSADEVLNEESIILTDIEMEVIDEEINYFDTLFQEELVPEEELMFYDIIEIYSAGN
ncbi:hypothetical protein Mzhil_0861 [Methanosalsum zhilinae DSM 4017]|uniref:Uncharacterized protein n=1 Tax=Methanosalsum zhilinae (strain DSM 4017 / NBRC 107636 / OCM 62 / WeN5) TaxID=679901 RepID=F7XL17_METZD|nr:hypothetical protein [Methanosalsum zhilinae]AEH60723.1 hypothetical protein Mzhil_0861 [Methanosalsum zhilinae DSM 4017]